MHKVILLIFVLIGCLPNTSAAVDSKKKDPTKPHYSLIIDAGSSGSRIYIYKIQPGINDGLPEIEFIENKKVEPGISNYEHYPDSMRVLMGQLLSFAESKIDPASWEDTELYLMATAGMRLLTEKQQKSTLKELTSYFKQHSKFDFKKAVIISGQYEALYGWSVLNYIDDRFNPATPRESMMEMGGASTQITFLSEESKGKDILSRSYAGSEYAIFAKSYLYMGQDQAQRLTAVPACYPTGYVLEDAQEGTGDFMECSQGIQRIFNEICDSLDIADSLFKSNFQANTENEFMAIAAFYYTFDALSIKDSLTLDVLKSSGTDFCGTSWDKIKEKHGSSSYVKSYCFNAAYFWTLLGLEYGFEHNLSIQTKDKLNDQEITWTLGAALDLEMGHKPKKHK
jgi:apyrase